MRPGARPAPHGAATARRSDAAHAPRAPRTRGRALAAPAHRRVVIRSGCTGCTGRTTRTARGVHLTAPGLAAGVDVGGTFTDCAAISPDGVVHARKVLSTPEDQGVGVVAALEALGSSLGPVTRLVHGTTVVTNLLLERTGARVVLCATAGATDLLELRRQDRASLYDLSVQHPAPLVAAADVIAVDERRGVRGVERALTDAQVELVMRAVLALRPEVVVISFLHAYADDAHERRLAQALREASPDLTVVVATAVLPEIREYERTATAVAEGYARPGVGRYLDRLGERLRRAGFPAPAVMTSGGGMRNAADAAQHAASLALSGPAGGVVGAAAVLRAAGIADALTIDIGGTSADAGLILAGEPLVEPGGSVAGVPIALPRVLVETVSAGGGSIAWVDEGGALRVGPRSAGARPGPVAFGRGGTEPTVTDAQVVLGRIGSGGWSGGVALDREAAHAAVARLAARLGATVERTAAAVVRAADAEMARALRRVSVDRGVDPRDCALVGFGGGGPLHACALADALAMRTVLVPPFAGVLSAVGLAIAPERREAAASLLVRTAALDSHAFRAACDALAARVSGHERRWQVRVRYEGQGHELEVAAAPGDSGREIADRFEQTHRTLYGFTLPRAVECVALRHVASDPGARAAFRRDPLGPPFDARGLVDRGGPAPGDVLRGPLAVTLPDATLWVAEGWTARALAIGGWRLDRDTP
ncbi:MAG: hydantoinase/oxoprolinase family protein [Gemmatimonadetes bacterium]|nr:hydantoinase/oxoprolinase family protein [Gemmatimonadota bacterium]